MMSSSMDSLVCLISCGKASLVGVTCLAGVMWFFEKILFFAGGTVLADLVAPITFTELVMYLAGTTAFATVVGAAVLNSPTAAEGFLIFISGPVVEVPHCVQFML